MFVNLCTVSTCISLHLEHPTTCSSTATVNLFSRNQLSTLVRTRPGSFNHITGSVCSGECQKLNQLCITFWASIGRKWPCSPRHEVTNDKATPSTQLLIYFEKTISVSETSLRTNRRKKWKNWPTWPLLPTPTAPNPSCLNGTPRAAARRSAGVKGHSSCTNITRPVKTLS